MGVKYRYKANKKKVTAVEACVKALSRQTLTTQQLRDITGFSSATITECVNRRKDIFVVIRQHSGATPALYDLVNK